MSSSSATFPDPVHTDGKTTFSPLQTIGKQRTLLLPSVLASTALRLQVKEALGAVADHADIENRFPTTYGRSRVVLEADPTVSSSSCAVKPLR